MSDGNEVDMIYARRAEARSVTVCLMHWSSPESSPRLPVGSPRLASPRLASHLVVSWPSPPTYNIPPVCLFVDRELRIVDRGQRTADHGSLFTYSFSTPSLPNRRKPRDLVEILAQARANPNVVARVKRTCALFIHERCKTWLRNP